MTREEQIKKQADIYTDDASNYTEWSDDGGWSDTNDIDLVEKAFIEGAKWSDENPKSPWISVEDDLPINHKELLSKGSSSTKRVIVIDDGGYYFDCMTLCKNGNWKWIYSFNPSHWLSIPKIPKRNRK